MKRLAIITTHPIQYNAPLFRLLNERECIAVKVFYTWSQSKDTVFDARFGLQRSWDIPLLDGYEYEFVLNSSKHPDSNRFWGIINPGLIKQLKLERFDAILVLRWSLYSHLRILRSFGGYPQLFFRGDSHLLKEENPVKALIKKWFLRFVYKKVDRAFYVGEHSKTYYLQSGLKPDQLLYTPHAIDNDRFSMDAGKWEALASAERASLSIPQTSIVFLYAGKFYPAKQLAMLIDAFQKLEGDRYRLLLVGNGEDETELRASAAGDNRIIFQPFRNQSEMPWVYRIGDVFVLPSKSETWGLAVNEAMACSRPAIVSDACGCATELIVQGETGFTFNHTNKDELLKMLQQFNSRQTAEEMGKRSLAYINHFSLERVAAAIEEAVLNQKQ